MNWIRSTEPTDTPLSLADARLQCRLPEDQTDEDGLLQSLIAVAAALCESYTNRGLLTQSWTLTIDDWFDVLWLPMAAPLQSVTSVKYYAADGTFQTLDSSYYVVDTVSEPGRIVRAPNKTWPALQSDRLSRIEVIYAVGWASADSIPAPLKQGQQLLVSHLFVNREAVNIGSLVTALPFGVEALWAPYRVWTKPAVCA